MDNIILTNLDNGVFTITLNRLDKKNALTSAMYLSLTEHFSYASESDDVHCLVIQGNENCFCAGNDLADFLNAKSDEELPAFQFIQRLASFDKPIIAAVAGAAVGIGTTLLLHSDIIVAAENAKFALPFSKLGLCPEAASSYLLPQMVGHAKAFELLVLGDTFDAQQALSLNLINHITSSEALLDTAQQYAKKIASLPSDAVVTSRALIKQSTQLAVSNAMAKEADEFGRLMQTQDCKNILQQFLSKS